MSKNYKANGKIQEEVVGVNCVKDANRKVLVENDEVKEVWRKHTKKLLNTWDNIITCEKVEGPCELIRRDEISKALRMMKKDKAASCTGIVSEMFIADEDCSVEWLTYLCSLIVAQGRITDDWKSGTLLPLYKEKGNLMQ